MAPMTGTIKRLVSDKGFGFILAEDANGYLFHNSACTNTRFDDLREGQNVTFEKGQGPKGPRGENVQSLGPLDATSRRAHARAKSINPRPTSVPSPAHAACRPRPPRLAVDQQTLDVGPQHPDKGAARGHARHNRIEGLADTAAHRHGRNPLRHFAFHLARGIGALRAAGRHRLEIGLPVWRGLTVDHRLTRRWVTRSAKRRLGAVECV